MTTIRGGNACPVAASGALDVGQSGRSDMTEPEDVGSVPRAPEERTDPPDRITDRTEATPCGK